jgi:hypothetical protein
VGVDWSKLVPPASVLRFVDGKITVTENSQLKKDTGALEISAGESTKPPPDTKPAA